MKAGETNLPLAQHTQAKYQQHKIPLSLFQYEYQLVMHSTQYNMVAMLTYRPLSTFVDARQMHLE